MFKYRSITLISVFIFLQGCTSSTDPGNNQRILFGWAAGCPKDSTALVIRTLNGGELWTRCGAHGEIPPVYISCIEAVDHSIVWLAGDAWDGYGLVMRSEDGGQTWSRKPVQAAFPNEGVGSIYSLDKYRSWASGSNGAICFTTDAGETWIQKNDSQTVGYLLGGVKAFNSLVVWAVGGSTGANDSGIIVRTTDGGTTWQRQAVGTEVDSCYLITISAPDTSCAWAVGHGYIVMRTTDGGQAWNNVSPYAVSGNDANGIVAFDKDNAWVVMDYNNVFRTTDGGQTWNKQTVPVTDQFITRISAIDRNTAWAVGSQSNAPFNHGAILYTSDGGDNWVEQTNPVEGNLYCVSFYGEIR
ncbi:hypothetical protein JXL83_02460 [candidate division WOR-3 bacterium]|nr:hypothetical protein [candidate division WOR-3 bacterium]